MSNNISKTGQTTELTANVAKMELGKANLQKEAEALFTKSYFNGGQDSIDDIEARIAKINEQIADWQKKIDKLQDQVDKIEDKIDNTSGKLSDKIGDLNEETRKFEADLKEAIDLAITNAVRQTKQKNSSGSRTTSFETEFQTQLDKLAPDFSKISAIYSNQNGLSDELKDLCGELDGVIMESNAAANGLKNAQAIVTLLTQTKDNMTAEVGSLYSNANNDPKVPIFTYEKEVVVADLASKYGDIGARGEGQIANNGEAAGRDEAGIKAATDSIKALGGATTGSGDAYSAHSGNEAMKNLSKALFGDKADATQIQEGSLVYDLAKAGASNTEILDLLSETFGNLGIKKNGGGSYTIPYGHATRDEQAKTGKIISGHAQTVYSAVNAIANGTAGLPEPAKTAAADTKDIDNAKKAVTEMASKGFTFKEAMYALDQIFPGLDIGYSLAEQGGAEAQPQGLVRFTSDKSYTPLAEHIRSFTGKGGKWEDSKVIQADKAAEVKPAPTTRTDPISVKDGNKSFYFMADDGNGTYDGVTDLLGSKDGMADFDTQYKDYITTNAKGEKVITGDALDSIMVMVVEENDHADSKGVGGVGVKQSFMSAKDAGITEINLSSAKESGKHDINGAEIQNTFDVKMNGKTMTAEQTLEDADYLEATLNNDKLTGENMFSQLTSKDVENAFKNTGKYSGDISKLQDIKDKAQELKDKLDGMDDGSGELTETESEFRNRVNEEIDYAKEIAKHKGDELYDEMAADFSDSNDTSGYGEIMDKNGKILSEEISKGVTEEIQKKYETYGK